MSRSRRRHVNGFWGIEAPPEPAWVEHDDWHAWAERRPASEGMQPECWTPDSVDLDGLRSHLPTCEIEPPALVQMAAARASRLPKSTVVPTLVSWSRSLDDDERALRFVDDDEGGRPRDLDLIQEFRDGDRIVRQYGRDGVIYAWTRHWNPLTQTPDATSAGLTAHQGTHNTGEPA